MDRLYVICHMCTTIDGKILPRRWGRVPGVRDSADLFETTAASFGIGAWLVGTTTMREFSGRQARLPDSAHASPRGRLRRRRVRHLVRHRRGCERRAAVSEE